MKLHQKGKIEKWGIKDASFLEVNREHLLTDFEFAQPHMLPQETEELDKLK